MTSNAPVARNLPLDEQLGDQLDFDVILERSEESALCAQGLLNRKQAPVFLTHTISPRQHLPFHCGKRFRGEQLEIGN